MGKPLVVELNEKTYAALQRKAEKAGLSPAHLVADSIERQFGRPNGTARTAAEARARFERHFGSVDLGRATGADNESIDDDLVEALTTDRHFEQEGFRRSLS